MTFDEKYLPTKVEMIEFFKGRIKSGKASVLGGKVEIETVTNHSADKAVQENSLRAQEYQLEQLYKDIDYYENELAKLLAE